MIVTLDEQAERALKQARDGAVQEAELAAQRVLCTVGPEASAARATALEALALVRVATRPLDAPDAHELFAEAADLWAALGDSVRRAAVVVTGARTVDLRRGDHAGVVRRTTVLLDDTLPPAVAFDVRLCRAEAHVAVAEVEAAAKDLDHLAERADDLLVPTVHRVRAALLSAEMASLGGDVEDAIRYIRAAEVAVAHLGPVAAAEVHAVAADVLDVLGDRDGAWSHLEAADRLVGARYLRSMVVAELALHARHGDPARAEEAAVALRRFPDPGADDWRLLLLRALAALRRRDHRAGKLAVRAFEAAGSLVDPGVVHVREPEAARAVHELAVTAGSTVAAALPPAAPALQVVALDGFEVVRGGVALEMNEQGARIVKLLTCCSGSLHVDELTSVLWPDADPGRGRQRLRNALTRLRRVDGRLVIRDGDVIRFGDTVSVDADHFAAEARRGLAAAAAGEPAAAATLRFAVACYGEFLPFDRYQSWSAQPRDRLRRLYVAVLDALVRDARGRGDLDEAVAFAELGLAAQPDAEERYIEAARLHLARGSRSCARRMLHGAGQLVADLELAPSPAHRELEEALRGAE